jgi:hypothetical protein
MERTRLLSLIKEAFRTIFNESADTEHSLERFEKRIRETKIGTDKEMEVIYKNLDIIRNVDFLKKYSYAVKIMTLRIDKDSPYYYYDNGDYYRIEDDIKPGEYSIGNEIWAVIRGNETKTIMLRRSSQNENIDDTRKSVIVDYAIRMKAGMTTDSFDNYIKKILIYPPKPIK